MQSSTDLILARWVYRAKAPETAIVLPDGCRDLVLVHKPGEPPSTLLTELDSTPKLVRVVAGSVLTGLRLRPGASLRGDFLRSMRHDETLELICGGGDLSSIVTVNPYLEEALQALAAERERTGRVSNHLGVSERTLHRLVYAGTGRPPKWWQRLARVRRTALALKAASDPGRTVADIAYAHGFADQAHLSREVKHWFGMTPRSVMAQSRAADLLHEPGYATP